MSSLIIKHNHIENLEKVEIITHQILTNFFSVLNKVRFRKSSVMVG